MTIPRGRRFWKMSGSGNDFIFFDARHEPPGELTSAEAVGRLCARGTGVGADGLVFLQADKTEAFRITYFNRDGSLGELCGNASLCSSRLAIELGIVDPAGFRFLTDAGVIAGRIRDGLPEIDLQPVSGLRADAGIAMLPGEHQLGFADSGVPHVVVRVDDVDAVDVEHRGRELRFHPTLANGANINFISRAADHWRIRTFERGVEAETLACGTGSVASGVLLEAWGESGSTTAMRTRSGRTLTVTVRHDGPVVRPSLRGEARIVFSGELGEV